MVLSEWQENSKMLNGDKRLLHDWWRRTSRCSTSMNNQGLLNTQVHIQEGTTEVSLIRCITAFIVQSVILRSIWEGMKWRRLHLCEQLHPEWSQNVCYCCAALNLGSENSTTFPVWCSHQSSETFPLWSQSYLPNHYIHPSPCTISGEADDIWR